MRSTFKLMCLGAVVMISVTACGGSSPKATPVPAATATTAPSVGVRPGRCPDSHCTFS